MGPAFSQPATGLGDLSGAWQLFVDDDIIAASRNLTRVYHPFVKHASNPLIQPDRPWEGSAVNLYGTVLPAATGPGFSMWYHANPKDAKYRLLYAESRDGLHWVKPALGRVAYAGSRANNIFISRSTGDHIVSVLHTPWEREPAERNRMINFDAGTSGFCGAFSADGLDWRDVPGNPLLTRLGDVGVFNWDPLRQRYLGYLKVAAQVAGMQRRAVGFASTKDFLHWPRPQLVLAPDAVDDRWCTPPQRTHFYGMCGFAYQSMYLGFLWIFRATDKEGYFDGPIFVELVSSRDGEHWRRQDGDRPPILPLGPPAAWDSGMVFSVNHPLLVGDKLWLYYGGYDVTHAAPGGRGCIGLATLRKDGFAALASGRETGEVTTALLAQVGGPLRLNYTARPGGWVKVEVRDGTGAILAGYGAHECMTLQGDCVEAAVRWKSREALPDTSATMRLRFLLHEAELYSFRGGP